MAYSDPYEEWKSLGRPAGTFEDWIAGLSGGGPPDPNVVVEEPGGVTQDDKAYIAEVRASGQGKSEDYARFSDEEILAWRKYYQGGGKFRNIYGDIVDKPDERGPNTPPDRNGTGDIGEFGAGGGFGGGGGGGGGGMSPGGSGAGFAAPGAGEAPKFTAPQFVAPTYEQAVSDPGYQFSLKEGADQLQRSAAARGLLRSGGTLKDLIGYGQDRAAQQYSDVFDRELQKYGTQFQGAQAEFQPLYGAWQTKYGGDLSKWQTEYGGDLSKWTTRYGGDLSKYLQREGNIYDLLSQPPPTYGG